MVDVLIVDDTPHVAQMLLVILELEGFTAHRVRHASDALAWLEEAETPPGMLLMDFAMPEMDGPTFIRRVAAMPGLAGMPIVVMATDLHVHKRLHDLPVALTLYKPFSIDRLLGFVQRIPLSARAA
jgi:CheY-like chemotaxis protein